MNLEFLQAICRTNPQEDTTPWNNSQAVYAMFSDAYQEICETIEKALENNQEYQKKMSIASALPEEAREALTRHYRRIETDRRIIVFDEIRQFYLSARYRLLTEYGKYITAKIACPQEIVNLFMPDQRRKIIGQPLEDQLVQLAMQTQW